MLAVYLIQLLFSLFETKYCYVSQASPEDLNSLHSSGSHELAVILLPQPHKCYSYNYVHHPQFQ